MAGFQLRVLREVCVTSRHLRQSFVIVLRHDSSKSNSKIGQCSGFKFERQLRRHQRNINNLALAVVAGCGGDGVTFKFRMVKTMDSYFMKKPFD